MKSHRVAVLLLACPSRDEPCAVTWGADADGHTLSAVETKGRVPFPTDNGHYDCDTWVRWAKRRLRNLGIDWANAEVAPLTPGSADDARSGVRIHTTMRKP